MYWVLVITQTMSQMRKGRDTGKSIYTNKKLLDMLENAKKSYFSEFRAPIQERLLLLIPHSSSNNRSSTSSSQGFRIRSQETSNPSRTGRDPMRKGTLATVAKTSGTIGQCGSKTSFKLCSNKEGSGTKDDDFSVTHRE